MSATKDRTLFPKGEIRREPTYNVSVVTSSNPAILGKRYSKNASGEIQKDVIAHTIDGEIARVELERPDDLVDLIKGLKRNQALCYGVASKDKVKYTSRKKLVQMGNPDSHIARTEQYISWDDGGGVLMLDYDPGNTEPLGIEVLLKRLEDAYSILSDVTVVWTYTSSSFIYDGEQQISGSKGIRIYFFLKEATDIPRVGNLINQKLWSLGYGRYEVSKSGRLLERPLFDNAIYQPNRLDFASGAICMDNLSQKRGDPKQFNGSLEEALDSKCYIRELSEEELISAEKHKKIARELLAQEAKSVASQYRESCKEKLLKRFPDTATMEIMGCVDHALDSNALSDKWVVSIIKDGAIEEVTVEQILENPDHYHEVITLDPIEPEYNNYCAVGILYTNQSRPVLHSMAHGGVSYRLIKDVELIQVVQGTENIATKKAIKVLNESPDFYDFGSEIVLVDESGSQLPLTLDGLRFALGEIIQFWSWKVTEKVTKQVFENPRPSICKSILALKETRKLKNLIAIITAPTLKPNGAVLRDPGFDSETGLLYIDAKKSTPIYDNPTEEQAKAALKTLWLPFNDFPFVDKLDRAVMLSALLSAAIRPILPTTPAFGIDAPVQASGKTLLAQCLGVIATGKEPGIWPHTSGRDDEEIRKRLFTALLSGKLAIVWDNVVGSFDSVAMASLLTSGIYTDRILGASHSSSVPNRMMLLMTGNNLTLKGDLARRVLICRIDPETDRPFARAFDLNPYTYCLANRQQLIAAAITLIRFYLSAKVERPGAGRMASFEEWDDLIRQTVIHIDQTIAKDQFGDVMDKVIANQEADPEHEALSIILHCWVNRFGDKAITASELHKYLDPESNGLHEEAAQMRDAFEELSFGSVKSARALGKVLGYRKDRIVDGLRLERAGEKEKTALWRVTAVSGDKK